MTSSIVIAGKTLDTERHTDCLADSGTPGRTRHWLLLAIAALIAAGFLAIVLVLSRTPAIQDIIPWQEFFKTALVVHVDLSVLIWFLAFAGLFWSLIHPHHYPVIEFIAFSLVGLGTAVLLISPFTGDGHPLMNNYVPVLQTPVFLAGLLLIGLGIGLQALRALLSASLAGTPSAFITGSRLAALCVLLALAGVVWSALGIPEHITGQAYYEYLFWGGGHILQFAHTVLLLLAWRLLVCHTRAITPKQSDTWLLVLAAAPALGAIPIYLNYDITAAGFRLGFTELMRYGGLAAAPAMLWIAWLGISHKTRSLATPGCRSALNSSWILFAAGGILGFLIQGINVVIPAHYHGSIVGITLAYMGISYLLLEHWGHPIRLKRTARWQPYIYGGGQFLHIMGLAWSGGYGVQRKTAGAAQGLDSLEKTLGMGLMGLGGMIAVIGGILFLVVTLDTLARRESRKLS